MPTTDRVNRESEGGSGCAFCEPRARYVFESKFSYAIYDRFPVTPGHLLIVTRRHVATCWELSEVEEIDILRSIRLARGVLDAERTPHGYNIGHNAGAAAGQTVSHFHLHVIPRYEGDMADPRGGVRHVIPSKGNYLASVPDPADRDRM